MRCFMNKDLGKLSFFKNLIRQIVEDSGLSWVADLDGGCADPFSTSGDLMILKLN